MYTYNIRFSVMLEVHMVPPVGCCSLQEKIKHSNKREKKRDSNIITIEMFFFDLFFELNKIYQVLLQIF